MHRLFSASTTCAILTAAVLAGGPARAQEAVPLQTRNLNPLVVIFGIPTWDVPEPRNQVRVTSELANHYRLSLRGNERLILDGETWRTSFYYDRAVGAHGFVGVELPYYQFSGGILDSLIDGWHHFFNLPDGGRRNRPHDLFDFQMADENGVFYNNVSGGHGIGDIQLSYSRRFGADGGFIAKAALKLPTGDEKLLAGSGSTDVALTLLRSKQVTFAERPAGYFWGIGWMVIGDAKVVDFDQHDNAYIATLGGGWRVLPRIGFKLQLDLTSPFYHSALEEIGQTSGLATIGGWWEARGKGVLDFGVVEDLHVSTAPDVVLHVGYRWIW
jgi:Protein of unknown function (DUF3187)